MPNSEKRTSLILHGHFYQPPRENPLTDIIPKQPSAAPYEDWNERIFHDCYNSNSHSRYLDSNGRIISLTNNYAYISFNFGPTLLHWLEEKHPETIELLYEADRSSIERLGHGNAMAQSFNHTILPLDSEKDAKLQIDWGIQDFQHVFKRDPEGMWLPECGINESVIDLLSESGIKFVVLSPWQCKMVEDESGDLKNLDGKAAPYWEPFILEGKKGGKISAFFYHPGLAEGISFGHMLRSADGLYKYVKDLKEREMRPLIHTATDGEIYGHHEPYGDMALAAMIKKVEEKDDFIFDNYASYLERNPATKRAVLHEGEMGLGTSWSCSHGVSRWFKDCGCHTGGEDGWNQRWRGPLRSGLNNLSQKLERIFDEEIEKVFSGRIESQRLLSMAGEVFSGSKSLGAFLNMLQADYGLEEKDRVKVAHLISGMKNKHFSFTSCGFFFSDISGIEPRQDIKYALYAISMFQSFCKEDLLLPFLSDLREAKSNIKNQGDGMTIAQEEMKWLSGEVEAALYFFMNRSFALKDDYKSRYGQFLLMSYTESEENPNIEIMDRESQESFSFTILSAISIEHGINLYICENDNEMRPMRRFRIQNSEIPMRMLDEIMDWIDRSMTKIEFNEIVSLSNNIKNFSTLVRNSKYIPMGTLLLENLGMALKILKSMFISHSYISSKDRREIIGSMLDFVSKNGRSEDFNSIKRIAQSFFENLATKVKKEGLTENNAEETIQIIGILRNHSIEPEVSSLQDIIYEYKSGRLKSDAPVELLEATYQALNFQ